MVRGEKREGWGRGETEEGRYIGAVWCGAYMWWLKSRLLKSTKWREKVKIEVKVKVKWNQFWWTVVCVKNKINTNKK